MELTATEKTLIAQSINTHLKALEELEDMSEGLSAMAKQAIIEEIVMYRKLKQKVRV